MPRKLEDIVCSIAESEQLPKWTVRTIAKAVCKEMSKSFDTLDPVITPEFKAYFTERSEQPESGDQPYRPARVVGSIYKTSQPDD